MYEGLTPGMEDFCDECRSARLEVDENGVCHVCDTDFKECDSYHDGLTVAVDDAQAYLDRAEERLAVKDREIGYAPGIDYPRLSSERTFALLEVKRRQHELHTAATALREWERAADVARYDAESEWRRTHPPVEPDSEPNGYDSRRDDALTEGRAL